MLMKRMLLTFIAVGAALLGAAMAHPGTAFACGSSTNPCLNWQADVLPPGQQTLDQNNLNVQVWFVNLSQYSIIFPAGQSSAVAIVDNSWTGPSLPVKVNINPNPVPPDGFGWFEFIIPANYFDGAGLSPGTHQAIFAATMSFVETGAGGTSLQSVGAASTTFNVIVGSTSTGPTSPGCIPGVTCSGAPPPVQTLPATMTLQATTPGGQDEPAGTAKFGDQVTATVTATSPSEPPPPPDAVSFAWTGPTTIQNGTLNFPGIPGTETNIQSSPSTTTGTSTGTTTAFGSGGGGVKDTTNTPDNMSAQYGGPPADSWCYNSLDPTCANPNVAQFKEYNNPGEGQLTFLEDTGGWPPGKGQQGTAYSGWNNGGSGWPVRASLTVTRTGVFTIQWTTTACSGSGKSVTCWTVVHTAQDPVTVQAHETAQASFEVTGSNRWELSVWEGGNGLP